LGAALFSLPACQTTGGTPATALQTFDTIYAGAVQAETLALQGTTAALNAKAITATQAKKVESALDAVKTVLDASHGAALAGNTGLATVNLSSAVGAIATISVCLTGKPLTPTTFDACMLKINVPQLETL
jgi:hypothetical protein